MYIAHSVHVSFDWDEDVVSSSRVIVTTINWSVYTWYLSSYNHFTVIFGEMTSIKQTFQNIPSGKRLHNYGKSPCLMGKLTINGHFQ